MRDKNKNVLIMTFHCRPNFGQQLQNYALSEKIKSLGYQPRTIRWAFAYLYSPDGTDLDNLKFFRSRYILSTDIIFTERQLRDTIKESDKIIVGSDQVFRNCGGKSEYMPTLRYFCDFVYGKKLIASYAASFATYEFAASKYLTDECKKLLKRFDRISVREKSGVDILKKTFEVDAVEVLDPVFLLRSEEYENLIKNAGSPLKQDKDYIAFFCLDSPKIDNLLEQNLGSPKIINIQFNDKGHFNTVEQWLSYIKNAKFVITDSFHCTAFSIIFKKPFVVVSTKGRGNARIDNILENFNLQHCRRETVHDIMPNDFNITIDWDSVGEVIDRMGITSDKYLKDVLSINPTYKKPYVNWPLLGIRSRYEKAYIYHKKAKDVLSYKFGLKHKILRVIIKSIVDKKRYNKLKQNHITFFQDSQSLIIKFLGRFYN